MPLALRNRFARFESALKLPESVPPFGRRTYNFYRVLWFAAFALALIGPIMGIYDRMSTSVENSDLISGSRLGIAISEQDATKVRFPVGPEAVKLGIKAGDKLVSLDGLPLPEKLPYTEADRLSHAEDGDYVLFENLVFGTSTAPVTMRLRSPDGHERDVTITPGDQHIDAGARHMYIGPAFLNFIDLLHVITYPFLLLAAWFLHKRKERDPVSSILSLAILLTMGTEMPSASFLINVVQLPRPIHAFLYDLGNICLLGGILLFPHGKLSRRLMALVAALPVLFFLHGQVYKFLFVLFMLCAVMMMVGCLRKTTDNELRQQVKWALFGFSGYALFWAISITCDMVKPQAGSFATQIILEMVAGLSLGLAFLTIQLGLLIALVRYRLYDAEFFISRSATFASITLILGAVVAGVIQFLGTFIQNTFGSNAGAGAAGIGAGIATVMISPIYERINKWMEQRFQKKLIELQNDLPELMRDLRETSSLPELMHEVLMRVRNGVQTVRAAVVIEGEVKDVSDTSQEEVEAWLTHFNADPHKKLCDSHDKVFRVRVPLCAHDQLCLGWLLIGPRPDGTSLRDDEQDTLVEIADPIARAIRIVMRHDHDERALNAVLDDLRQRLELLEGNPLAGKLQAQA
jgi:hypothetical protein